MAEPARTDLAADLELGRPLVATAVGEITVELRRSARDGRLWSYERHPEGSTGTPIEPAGTAWEIADALVAAGALDERATAVEVVADGRARAPDVLAPTGEWLLVLPGAGTLAVRQLDGDGHAIAEDAVARPQPAPAWRSKWPPRRLGVWRRRLPSGHHAYGTRD